MNERIKELAKEAYRADALRTNPDWEPNDWSDSLLEDMNGTFEKFAELIIKECMSMCDETQANYLKHRKATIDFAEKNIFAEGEAASDVIKYKMKKHFGIE